MRRNFGSCPPEGQPWQGKPAIEGRLRIGLGSGLLVLLCAALFFYRLGDRDLWSSHEGRAAQDAQTILSDGGWGLPRLFDGRYLELQKPPLYYWLVALIAGIRRHDVDAWDARLPAAIAGTAGVLGLAVLGTWRRRPVAGMLAAGILATALHYTSLARTGRIDLPLTATVGAAVSCWYLGEQARRERGGRAGWPWLLVAYAAIAVGLLLKGPIGAILPIAVTGGLLLAEGQLPVPWRLNAWRELAGMSGLWWGVPLVLSLAGPWYVWAQVQTHGQFGRTFFWYHNVERALGAGGLRAHPWWFYGPRLALDFLPWSPALPIACWWLWRGAGRSDPEARLGLSWLASVLLVLSCAGFKRADYLVPAYPGAALLLGCMGERWYQAARARWALLTAFGAVLIGCMACWWMYLVCYLPREDSLREERTFAAAIRHVVPAPETVIFFRLEDHLLAFHVGRPLYTLMEWENLNAWAARSAPVFVVMSPDVAAAWPAHLSRGRLEEVFRNSDFSGGHHERPLILFRTRPVVR